ncbi:hypothetical protein CPSG_03574 [Coccidioides posadasii str. Silveira]|uniref:Uncharacterized protein n=1 Tax=Coccidioides posadasii (strain RMSCC 757 / Silveira) TaxID=443226 RepID=E9D0E6_COCPS|nr:hypothetical protein CPSG_03574 [Coccidioides posadasii str. Silveira]
MDCWRREGKTPGDENFSRRARTVIEEKRKKGRPPFSFFTFRQGRLRQSTLTATVMKIGTVWVAETEGRKAANQQREMRIEEPGEPAKEW